MDFPEQEGVSTDATDRLVRRFRLGGIVAAWASMAVAAAALLFGWTFGFPTFGRIVEGYPAMVPETALALLAGGTGTILSFASVSRVAIAVSGAVVLALVLLTNTAHPFATVPPPNDAMSVATSTSLLLLGAALMLDALAGAWGERWARIACTLGLCLTSIPLIGYLFNAHALFSNSFYTQMALQTTLSLMALFLALQLVHPEEGWLGVLSAPEQGSAMLRRLLPFIVLGPILLCGLALYASRQDMVTPDLRAAALTFGIIFSTSAAAIYFAKLTNQSERAVQEANRLMIASELARREAEVSVLRAQKVTALGNLVGGVAHDFNNTLAVILGNLELLEASDDREQWLTYVREATAASKSAANLTQQLLAYGRKTRLRPERAGLDTLVGPTLAMFRRVCPASIVIETDLAAPGETVEVDVANFQQALLNILINARDSQPGGGRIRVSTGSRVLAEDKVVAAGDTEALTGGPFAVVTVQDDGPGMSAEVLARATEPFFTTKDVGEGSGLGLSVVSGFCLQSGGGLILDTGAARGLVASMLFPVVDMAPEPAAATAAGETAPTGTVSILIVDDEVRVGTVIRRQLELDGHDVRVATDAAEALAILSDGPLPDLVLTDLIMPGPMQGAALAVHIRKTYPSIRVLLMSGYESARMRVEAGAPEDVIFLQKPIERSMLRAAVREALAGRAT